MTQKTALYGEHEKLNATFTDFGGWEMPVKYGSDLAEHAAVRQRAGIFDLSHMGEIYVTGSQSGQFLDWALVGKMSAMKVGKAKYGMIVNSAGKILDDLITYRLQEDKYLVVPNASNAEVVWQALNERRQNFQVDLENATLKQSLVAVQGPKAADIVTSLLPADHAQALSELGYYACMPAKVAGLSALVARTGYTGEDGFEIIVDNADAVALWRAVLEAGQPFDAIPCGLAARDSLRLEAGMPLYGHELSAQLTPFDPGFGKVVAFKTKEDFFARKALEEASQQTPTRSLVGIVGEGRRAARAGYAVLDQDANPIGEVTSGMLSPTLGYPIAMAWVDSGHSEVGTQVQVDLRGKPFPYRVVELPFYRRQK